MFCTGKQRDTCREEKMGCEGCVYNDDVKYLENVNAGMLYFAKAEDYEKYANAINNVVREYKKLKEIEKEHQKLNGELREQLKNSVPKSKIEEKIKDLESKKDIKDNTTYTFKEVEEVIIQVLQELLESE